MQFFGLCMNGHKNQKNPQKSHFDMHKRELPEPYFTILLERQIHLCKSAVQYINSADFSNTRKKTVWKATPHYYPQSSLLVCCRGFTWEVRTGWYFKVSLSLSNYHGCVKINSAPLWQDGLVLHWWWSLSRMWQSSSQGSRSHYPHFPWGWALIVSSQALTCCFFNGIWGGAGCRPLWEPTWWANTRFNSCHLKANPWHGPQCL